MKRHYEKRHYDQGFASTQLLFMLIFVSAVSLGLGVYLHAYTRLEYRSKEKNNSIREMNDLLALIIMDLKSPNDPEIDCYDDPIWAWNNKTQGAYTIKINPISDKLNLNYLGKGFLEKSSLQHQLNPGRNPNELHQFRHDSGFSLSTDSYRQFFNPETLDTYFSCYGWANINLIDELTAMDLAYSLTGSRETAERLRIIVQNILLNRQPVFPDTLKSRLGNDYPKLFPYINAEPLMNVNFLPPPILKALITYPAYGVRQADTQYWEILERRSLYGISREELLDILGINPGAPLAGCLGSVTWFWEIIITGKGGGVRTVICRIPKTLNSAEPAQYTLIEQRYQ